jgi:putative intracellular protease/amidase
MSSEIRNIGILIFDDVEVLDFTGPYEVFSQTRLSAGVESRQSDETAPFNVFTVAKTEASVRARGGLSVNPDYASSSSPTIDLLLIPGGLGTRPILEDEDTLAWLKS